VKDLSWQKWTENYAVKVADAGLDIDLEEYEGKMLVWQ